MKRFDKGYIYTGLLTDLFYSFFVSFAFLSDFFVSEESTAEETISAIPILFGAFILIYLVFIAYRILYYRLSGYELTDKEIKCNRGVLFRKRSVLDYKRVHAINKKQTIVHRIFGIAVLTVDSGSANTSHQAEITIIEKSSVVDALLDKLNSLKGNGAKVDAAEQAGNEEEQIGNTSEQKSEEVLLSDKDDLYRFTSAKKMLYSLINIATAAFFTAFIALLAIIVIGACRVVLSLDIFGTWGEYLISAALISVAFMLLCSLFSFIVSLIQSFVGYYGFSITRRDNNIQISYGLLEKHTNTFSYDRIKAVKISQGIVQRMLGFASIRLEVIGYTLGGEENNNTGIGVLVPFCKYSEINEILAKVLPDYIPVEKQTKSVSLFPFVSWFTLFFCSISGITLSVALAVMAILNAPAVVISSVSLTIIGVTVIAVLIKLASAILSFHTNGVAVDGEKLTVYSGGFNKNITVFMAKHLVAVEDVTTPLRKKHGISSLVLHLKTNESSNEVKVHIQKDTLPAELEKMLTL